MRVKTGAALISTFAAFAFLTGCSINNSSSVVHAQTSYSVASLIGTYSINMSGITSAAGFNPANLTASSAELSNFIGSFKADGGGNISSGTLTQYAATANGVGGCSVTFSGQYNVGNDATGIATITVTSKPIDNSSSQVCTWSGPAQFQLQAGMFGESVHMTEADGKGLLSGIATRQ